jgi:hypothetical protein
MRQLPILVSLVVLAACAPAPPVDEATLHVIAVAGPTCPVVSDPPDPECADRPVDGAEIIVQRADGEEVARMTTDADGQALLAVESGSYILVPQPVEGLLGTAASVEVTVREGAETDPVTIAYDTGIR